ncbi:hypothetical protein OYE22_03680 [Streptomyces sp. 71268]|uniref:hypothetical protein n=1 Tax=Streptomyces sp. 71268 TaxID=3002640 RepID=UPI0023F68F85|nr:hypothetical protein [Streptomyces sp. 71268]WEV24404.1 hypothetical protein OYE22_03680 [Streptomyces sp. 71268]
MEHTRLTVTLRPGRGTLVRLAATLNHHQVLDFAYTAAPADAATSVEASARVTTAVIRVPRAHAPRAQQKLRRLVDVLDVAVDPAPPGAASTAPGGRTPSAGAPPR